MLNKKIKFIFLNINSVCWKYGYIQRITEYLSSKTFAPYSLLSIIMKCFEKHFKRDYIVLHAHTICVANAETNKYLVKYLLFLIANNYGEKRYACKGSVENSNDSVQYIPENALFTGASKVYSPSGLRVDAKPNWATRSVKVVC